MCARSLCGSVQCSASMTHETGSVNSLTATLKKYTRCLDRHLLEFLSSVGVKKLDLRRSESHGRQRECTMTMALGMSVLPCSATEPPLSGRMRRKSATRPGSLGRKRPAVAALMLFLN